MEFSLDGFYNSLISYLGANFPFMEDEELMRYVSELKDIKASHDSYRLLYDYGRIYNDVLNYLDIMYHLDGDTSIETLDKLLAKEEQKWKN